MVDVTKLMTPGMYHNDVDYDCTCASLVNGARVQSWIQNNCDLVVNPDAVLQTFLKATNWVGEASEDPGADPAYLLGWVKRNGLDIGAQAPLVVGKVSTFATTDRQNLADTVRYNGWAWVTLALDKGDWGVTEACRHQVIVTRVTGTKDTDFLDIGTWNMWKLENWEWFAKRVVWVWRVTFDLPHAPVAAPSPVEIAATKLTEPSEGFRSHPYQDPSGVWTIGYGSIYIQGRPSKGRVTADTPPVDEATARIWMENALLPAEDVVRKAVKVPLTDDEEAALIDFVYNVGGGNFLKSTLLRMLNEGNYAAAAGQFAVWDVAGGHVLAGLMRRRALDAALFRA